MIVECPGCRSRYDVSGRPPGTQARCRCGAVFALPAPEPAAGLLGCPSCGAGVSASSSRCEFCSADLLVRACPRCFARIFHRHKHCPACGVEVGVPAQAGPDGVAAPRACPACAPRPPLTARLVGGVLLDECAACLGVWLDAAAVDRVVRQRTDEAARSLRELGPPARDLQHGEPSSGSASAGRRMYLPCPDCGTVMNRVNFARRSGIIVDVCRVHGTWFDHQELPRVVEFVLRGGVEEAQRKDLEEAREAARRARAEAELARADGGGLASADYEVAVFGSALGLISRWLR